jgi:D-glycero-alpha-D-manno-heptose-7-phosphate kinase
MIVSRTPFRISLVGGGTDLRDYYEHASGAVLALSISKYMYVTVNRRFDDSIRVSYTKLEIVDRLDDLQHDLIRECLRMSGVTRGVEVTTIGDVPGGTGLGSSSSLTVGLLNALYAFQGQRVSAVELAQRACDIEITILKRPIGKQDQFMAACGGLRQLTFHRDGRVGTRSFRLAPSEARRLIDGLLLFYTGSPRDANVILDDVRRALVADVAKRRVLDDVVPVVHDLAIRVAAGDFSTMGEALNRSWDAKRRMSPKVTSERLDTLHAIAMRAGASGAKILGAGGGGFLLVACEPEHREAVAAALTASGIRAIDFDLERSGSTIIFPAPRRSAAAIPQARPTRAAGSP